MERPDPKDMIDVLTTAREILRVERQPYICWALLDIADYGLGNAEASLYLKDFIMESLHPAKYLGDWCFRNKIQTDPHQARLQWIDWMLEGLKKEVGAIDCAIDK